MTCVRAAGMSTCWHVYVVDRESSSCACTSWYMPCYFDMLFFQIGSYDFQIFPQTSFDLWVSYYYFRRKKIVMPTKPGFMRIKDSQTFMRMAYAEVLCGGFFSKKALCGALCCIKLKALCGRFMRHKALHKATLEKKLYALYAGSDAARECRKKTLCANCPDWIFLCWKIVN